MLIRKPSFFDIHKAVKLLSNDKEQQESLLIEWLKHLNDHSFFSFIALDQKQVIGVLTGFVTLKNQKIIFNLSTLVGVHPEVEEKLWGKVEREVNPDLALYTGPYKEHLTGLLFKIVSVNTIWIKPDNTNHDEVIDENTEREVSRNIA